MKGVIINSNGDDVDPTLIAVMMGVITISNGGDVDADSERGDDGGDHYQLQPTPPFAHP